MTTPYHRAAVALRHARSVIVCGHVRPDGDAIGSTLGLTMALREMGIPALPTLANAEPASMTYAFLPGFSLYVPAADLESADVFVALDTPTATRLGEAQALAEAADTLIVIDHHPDATDFGDVNLIDHRLAATGQMIWRLLASLEVVPSPEVALCLYVALLTDTGRFQYGNTTPEVFRDAAALLEAGVSASEAARLVYQERSAASLALEGRALSRLTFANRGRVVYSWIDDADFVATGARQDEAEHLPDAVRLIGGIDVAVVLRVTDGEVRGNLRAKTGFDVGSVARALGGGGHAAASGFTYEGELESLLGVLMPMLPGGDDRP